MVQLTGLQRHFVVCLREDKPMCGTKTDPAAGSVTVELGLNSRSGPQQYQSAQYCTLPVSDGLAGELPRPGVELGCSLCHELCGSHNVGIVGSHEDFADWSTIPVEPTYRS